MRTRRSTPVDRREVHPEFAPDRGVSGLDTPPR
jgi:hypothetical protein